MFGEQWLALVRKYPLKDPQAACPACALGTREWSLIGDRQGCDPHTARVQGIEPTRTLPHVCSLAASLLGAEVLKTVSHPCRERAAWRSVERSNARFAESRNATQPVPYSDQATLLL